MHEPRAVKRIWTVGCPDVPAADITPGLIGNLLSSTGGAMGLRSGAGVPSQRLLPTASVSGCRLWCDRWPSAAGRGVAITIRATSWTISAMAPLAATLPIAVSITIPIPTAVSIPWHVLWNSQNVGRIDDRGLCDVALLRGAVRNGNQGKALLG